MNRESQKAFFAQLNKKGFPVKHTKIDEDELIQAKHDLGTDNVDSYDHSITISEEQLFKTINNNPKTAEQIQDEITKTNMDDRLRNELRIRMNGLIKLQQARKVKIIDGKWLKS